MVSKVEFGLNLPFQSLYRDQIQNSSSEKFERGEEAVRNYDRIMKKRAKLSNHLWNNNNNSRIPLQSAGKQKHTQGSKKS